MWVLLCGVTERNIERKVRLSKEMIKEEEEEAEIR